MNNSTCMIHNMSLLSIFLSAFVVCLYAITIASASGSESVANENGLRWCDSFCLCPKDSDEKLMCLEANDIYMMLNFDPTRIIRLARVNFDPVTALKWCNDSSYCFCHKDTGKFFACGVEDLVTNMIEEAAQSLPADRQGTGQDGSTPVFRTAGMGGSMDLYDSETTPMAREGDSTPHRRRDMDEERRNRRRNNRKNRRNRKRNRNDEDMEGETFNSSENYHPTDESDVFDHPHENFDYTVEPSHMLPKQEAINSSPMVTAMQPPTRRQPMHYPPSTTPHPMEVHHGRHSFSNPGERDRNGPRVQESSHPDFPQQNSNMNHQPKAVADAEPIREVPLQRKTVAGRVSEDLKQITEDIQHIRNDVVYNQRILLVTVAVAGVAMLGVLILALHACCSKRSSSRRARITENGRHDDSHHLHHPSSTVTKVNIDEAW